MNHLDYIYTNTDNLIASSDSVFHYKGFLSNNSNNVFMRYSTDNWNTVKEVEMIRENDEFIANISLPADSKDIKFSFKNELDYWDNNYEDNYNFSVLPSDLNIDLENTISTDFYTSDLILEHNLNNEISNQFDEFVLSNDGEVIKKEYMKKEIENFDASLTEKLGEIKAILFEQNDVTELLNAAFIEPNTVKEEVLETTSSPEILDSAFIEVNNVKEESLVKSGITYYSKVPYVKLFKEAKLEVEQVEKINAKAGYTFYAKVSYAESLRELAKQQNIRYEMAKEENQFLVVAQHSNLQLLETSVIASVKNFISAFLKAYANLNAFLSRSMGFSESL